MCALRVSDLRLLKSSVVRSFATYMTGEVFSLFAEHSILRFSVEGLPVATLSPQRPREIEFGCPSSPGSAIGCRALLYLEFGLQCLIRVERNYWYRHS